MPGRQPLQFYLCSDREAPVEIESYPLKLNWTSPIVLTLSFNLHIFVWFKIARFKAKNNFVLPLGQSNPVLSGNATMMEKQSMSNFITNIFSILSLTVIFGIIFGVNKLLPSDFTQVYWDLHTVQLSGVILLWVECKKIFFVFRVQNICSSTMCILDFHFWLLVPSSSCFTIKTLSWGAPFAEKLSISSRVWETM